MLLSLWFQVQLLNINFIVYEHEPSVDLFDFFDAITKHHQRMFRFDTKNSKVINQYGIYSRLLCFGSANYASFVSFKTRQRTVFLINEKHSRCSRVTNSVSFIRCPVLFTVRVLS